ncbi:hypothetical protein ACEPAF_5434 [Sanghuangporus sanghuang]
MHRVYPAVFTSTPRFALSFSEYNLFSWFVDSLSDMFAYCDEKRRNQTHRDDGYVVIPTDADGDASREEASTKVTNGIFAVHGGATNNYTYAYGPGGVAGLRHNSYTLASAVLASIGGLLFGYDQGVIANVLVMKNFKLRWGMTEWQEGVMTAMLEMGALLGALIAGIFADRYSRRQAILTACFAFAVGSALQCAADSLTVLITGRAIGGLGIGSLSMLSPLYLAEISPPEVRGSLMALEQFAIVLGVVLGFWTGFSTRDFPGATSWRLPLAIQLIPAAVLAFGCLFLLPSPRLLIFQGRNDEALRVLARLRLRAPEEEQTDPLLKIEFLEMQVEAELINRAATSTDHKNTLETEINGWLSLFSPKYVERVMVGVTIMFFQQWSGINALIYYGPILMERIGVIGDGADLLGSGGIGIVQFFAVVPAIIYIDRLGRKTLLRWGGIIMGSAHLFIALLVLYFEDGWGDHHLTVYVAVGCIYIFTAAYGLSIGPIAWILPSEVLPLSIRSKGAALATASNWLNNFIIGLITPPLLAFSPAGTFAVFAVSCFGLVWWSRKYVPETAGVSLEEVDKLFKSDAGREDAELRREIMREVGLEALIRELSNESEGES